MFIKYDLDGDGRLSREELSKCLQAEFPRGLIKSDDQGASANSLMEEMDQNGDNFVDYKEFLTALSTNSGWAMSDPDELLRKARDDRLSYAYEQCKQLTSDYAKTFYLATLAMPAVQARATWAIYAWCRRVDEIVDGPSASPDAAVQEAALNGWMARLDQMWEGASTVRPRPGPCLPRLQAPPPRAPRPIRPCMPPLPTRARTSNPSSPPRPPPAALVRCSVEAPPAPSLRARAGCRTTAARRLGRERDERAALASRVLWGRGGA